MQALGFFILGTLAWLTALFAPPFLALWFWHTASKRLGGWIAHPLFLLCAFAVEWIAVFVLSYAAQDDGDGPPGLGLALILPFATLIGTVALYYTSVLWVLAQSVWRRNNVR